MDRARHDFRLFKEARDDCEGGVIHLDWRVDLSHYRTGSCDTAARGDLWKVAALQNSRRDQQGHYRNCTRLEMPASSAYLAKSRSACKEHLPDQNAANQGLVELSP